MRASSLGGSDPHQRFSPDPTREPVAIVVVVVVVRTMLLKFRDLARCCFIGSKRAPASAARISAAPTSPSAPPVPLPSVSMSLPDNDDLLREILLRLPPLPSSLPRASLVCRRWRRLVADPYFVRRFRQHHNHHRSPPPLLGYFFCDPNGPVFAPMLAPPDCIPPERFSLPRQQPDGDRLFFLGCRHGLALLINRRRLEAIVWDPVTGCRATVAYPPEFTTDNGAHCCRGTVLATADDVGIGDGHLVMRPFKVILIRTDVNHGQMRVIMCVYVSETAKWGHTISTTIPSMFVWNLPNVLVGNALCGFLQLPNGILEYDLERHSLGVIQTPKTLDSIDTSQFQVVRTQDGELGLAILSELSLELWGRRKACSSSDRVVGWVLQKTVQLDKLLSLPRMNKNMMESNLSAGILAFDEDNNAIHVSTSTGAFAIRLDSMQFTELGNVKRTGSYHFCHPYAGFYTAGVPRLSTA